MSTKQQRKLGALGLLRRPDRHTEKQIRDTHVNQNGEFEHKNMRNKNKKEMIKLDEIKRFKNHKTRHLLKGNSPHDGKPLTKIVYQ